MPLVVELSASHSANQAIQPKIQKALGTAINADSSRTTIFDSLCLFWTWGVFLYLSCGFEGTADIVYREDSVMNPFDDFALRLCYQSISS